ncbi:MAG: WYL domain-containing protein [Pseudoxanthomonas sp.]|nr:WYL domain-containing protein [Pseudoxanthomonas sp.]
MENSGQTLARQWAMLQAIPRSPLKITTRELESRLLDDGFEVSRRTIERDLQTLSMRFPLQLDDRSRPFGWSWTKDASFEFMPKLTASQAVALLLARTHLKNLLPDALQKELQPAFETAERALSSSGWRNWHRQTAVLPTGLSLLPPRIPSSVLSCASSALARNRVIRADYRAKGSRNSREMLIHPLGLLARGPVLYLVCTLFDYEDVRQLALHRISNSVETGEPARLPKDFDFRRYASEVASRLLPKGPIHLVARFDGPAAEHLGETPISGNQTWQELPDGRIEIAASMEDDETLRWWLMSFGSQVEVMEPVTLRAWMRDEITISSNRYKPSDESDRAGEAEQ